MKDNFKLNIALIVFFIISIIILPSIIGRVGNSSISKNSNKIEADLLSNQDMPKEIYKFTTDHLNMRTGPGTEFEKVITIPIGHKVQVIEEENDWNKIIYEGQTGYSSNNYLSDRLGEESLEDIQKNSIEDMESKDVFSARVVKYMKTIKGLILVNKDYGLPKNYYPGEDPVAKQNLDEMIKAAKKEINKELVAFSGFRSYNYQNKIYNGDSQTENSNDTSINSEEPGHSEHQTGLAYDIGGEMKYWLDIGFKDTPEAIWLMDNAHKYGFILRYPEDKIDITGHDYEPWHFRYVGTDHAKYIYENNLCLEEYLLNN